MFEGSNPPQPRTSALLLFLLVFAIALSGCSKPASDPSGGVSEDPRSGGDAASLPEPIHDERDIVATTGGMGALTCGDVRQCADFPFTLHRRAQLEASVSWGVASNGFSLRLLRDGLSVAWIGSEVDAPMATTFVMDTIIPAGEYILRVEPWNHQLMLADRWVVHATFGEAPPPAPAAEAPTFGPHVVVGVPDSGVNVYHEIYRRPNFTSHPCTYLPDIDCGLPALNLTFDAPTWQDAFEADRETWAAIKPGDRYWIPGTNIIGAICQQPYSGSTASSAASTETDYCIIDDSSMHGTGTSSSILSENPDALLVIVEGNSGGARYLLDGSFPIDIVSFSWGVPVPVPTSLASWDPMGPEPSEAPLFAEGKAPLFVAASGNEGAFPVALAGDKAHTSIITVGGADAGSRTEPGYSGFKTMDYVSEYCRPTAQTRTFNDTRLEYCGTSLSAPTFAGALSKAILEFRRHSGYAGGLDGDFVDPVLGITKDDVRRALNHSATYTPADAFEDGGHHAPLVAPWYQWGWGYFGRGEVPALLDCLLNERCTERPAETQTYMETLWEVRRVHSGEGI